jgi:hypothetical protein
MQTVVGNSKQINLAGSKIKIKSLTEDSVLLRSLNANWISPTNVWPEPFTDLTKTQR